MALANVALDSTFDGWRIRTNQILEIVNKLTEGQHNSTGTITLTNSSGLENALNVTNGSIRVGANTFKANAIGIISNTPKLTVSGSSRLGDKVFLDLNLVLSDSVLDSNVSNIASANSVYTTYQALSTSISGILDITDALGVSIASSYNKANNANITAVGAFAQANIANILALAANSAAANSLSLAISAFGTANTANTNANAANTKAYSINLTSLGVNTVIQPLLSQTSIALFKNYMGLGDSNTLSVMTPTHFFANTIDKLLTTDKTWAAASPVNLSAIAANMPAANIVVDMATFINGEITLPNNRLLLNPTNVVAGRSGTLLIRNVNTYNLAFDTKWRPMGNSAAAEAGNEMLLTWYTRDTDNCFFSWARAGGY